MSYTGLPGYYGTDEEESELTLGFWYLFQEALWNIEYDTEHEGHVVGSGEEDQDDVQEKARITTARAVYSELVQVLRRKVTWPSKEVLKTWTRGEEKFPFRPYRSH